MCEPNLMKAKTLHILSLIPTSPQASDDASDCFAFEPLRILTEMGVRVTALNVLSLWHSMMTGRTAVSTRRHLVYFSLPGDLGLPTAGAFLFARIIGKIRELNCKEQIDLLHAHGALPCGHAAMLVQRELRIPYVVSVYGQDESSLQRGVGQVGKWCQRISQRVYVESSRVLCTNEDAREKVLERLGQSCRTSVVHNGVDPNVFVPSSEDAEPANRMLHVSDLNESGGQVGLIRAIASLQKEFASISLDIIGKGAHSSSMRKLAQDLGVSDRVRLLTYESRQQFSDAMKSCTLFVLLSRSEHLECALLEAMGCGKTVIVCRREGITEIIQHGINGFLINPENEKQLELAIAMLLREPQRRKNLGLAAHDTILDRFTVKQQAENLMRIYRQCTN
jgi:teichuronic acid biosynthesis glycosyltransferase TuaC